MTPLRPRAAVALVVLADSGDSFVRRHLEKGEVAPPRIAVQHLAAGYLHRFLPIPSRVVTVTSRGSPTRRTSTRTLVEFHRRGAPWRAGPPFLVRRACRKQNFTCPQLSGTKGSVYFCCTLSRTAVHARQGGRNHDSEHAVELGSGRPCDRANPRRVWRRVGVPVRTTRRARRRAGRGSERGTDAISQGSGSGREAGGRRQGGGKTTATRGPPDSTGSRGAWPERPGQAHESSAGGFGRAQLSRRWRATDGAPPRRRHRPCAVTSANISPIREARARRCGNCCFRSKRRLDPIRVRSRESVRFSRSPAGSTRPMWEERPQAARRHPRRRPQPPPPPLRSRT